MITSIVNVGIIEPIIELASASAACMAAPYGSLAAVDEEGVDDDAVPVTSTLPTSSLPLTSPVMSSLDPVTTAELADAVEDGAT